MRIRSIKPEFWKHPIMARLADGCRLLAIGLLSYADDEGYFLADPILIRNDLFPFQNDSGNIPEWLRSLSDVGFIEMRIHPERGPLGRVISFNDHQRISHPTRSRIKTYWDSGNIPEMIGEVPEYFVPDQGIKGSRDQGDKVPLEVPTPPPLVDEDLFPSPEQLAKAMTKAPPMPVRVSFVDWRQDHPDLYLGRTGEDGDPASWSRLFDRWQAAADGTTAIMDEMYDGIRSAKDYRGRVYFNRACEWLTGNYEIVS